MDYEKIKSERFSFVYLHKQGCSVCNVMLPKIKELSERYDGASFYSIDLMKHEEAVGEFLVFSIPALIVFSQGKELLREARFFNIDDIKKRLDRYYNLSSR
jgi:thiol-disulfide isomerase/thioredoxin